MVDKSAVMAGIQRMRNVIIGLFVWVVFLKDVISGVGALTQWYVPDTDLIYNISGLGLVGFCLWLLWQSSKLINGLSENQPTKIDNEAA